MSETHTLFAALVVKSWPTRSGAIGWLCLESVVFTRNRRFTFERRPALCMRRAIRFRLHHTPRCCSVPRGTVKSGQSGTGQKRPVVRANTDVDEAALRVLRRRDG